MKYTHEQLNVGDEVYFEIEHLNNYDLYWKILSKNSDGTITVEIDEMARRDKLTIEIKDIKYHIPIKKKCKNGLTFRKCSRENWMNTWATKSTVRKDTTPAINVMVQVRRK